MPYSVFLSLYLYPTLPDVTTHGDTDYKFTLKIPTNAMKGSELSSKSARSFACKHSYLEDGLYVGSLIG